MAPLTHVRRAIFASDFSEVHSYFDSILCDNCRNQSRNELIMSATDERAKVSHFAQIDNGRALQTARKISEPWYRCQSLAEVALYAPDDAVARSANEAIAAAKADSDAYRRVAACAWPLRSLAERGRTEDAKRLLNKLVNDIEQEPHPVSRLYALILLWGFIDALDEKTNMFMMNTVLASRTNTEGNRGDYRSEKQGGRAAHCRQNA